MRDQATTEAALALQLAAHGLKIPDSDLSGMTGMARDLEESARAIRRERSYSLESLSGFSLVRERTAS